MVVFQKGEYLLNGELVILGHEDALHLLAGHIGFCKIRMIKKGVSRLTSTREQLFQEVDTEVIVMAEESPDFIAQEVVNLTLRAILCGESLHIDLGNLLVHIDLLIRLMLHFLIVINNKRCARQVTSKLVSAIL